MRLWWVLLLAGLAVCALSPAVPPLTASLVHLASLATPQAGSLVEDTFHLTQGIEVSQHLLPRAKGVTFTPAYLGSGLRVDAEGRISGRPERPGTYVAPVRVCSQGACEEQEVTLVVLPYVPWEPRELTFPGRVGAPLDGEIGVNGGPSGVVPTFTVTDHDKVPAGVSIGPDGHVGGVPVKAGISEVPVRICVAGNCAGVVVRLIIV